MKAAENPLSCFEIPALNIGRAQEFYEIIFDIEMPSVKESMGIKTVNFPSEIIKGEVTGILVESPEHEPSGKGTVIYLNANPDIQKVLDRVEEFDGKVIMPKTEISSEIGFIAFIMDTEGNKIGLHALN